MRRVLRGLAIARSGAVRPQVCVRWLRRAYPAAGHVPHLQSAGCVGVSGVVSVCGDGIGFN